MEEYKDYLKRLISACEEFANDEVLDVANVGEHWKIAELIYEKIVELCELATEELRGIK